MLFYERSLLDKFADALVILQRKLIAEAGRGSGRPGDNGGGGGGGGGGAGGSGDLSRLSFDADGSGSSASPAVSQALSQEEYIMANAQVKGNVHIRLHNLPPGFVKRNVSMISSLDCGNFMEVSGTVIRTGMIKMLEAEKEYQCTSSRCGHRFKVTADLAQDGMLDMPKRCPSGTTCKSTSFEYLEGSRICCDYQELRVQEQMQSLSVGMIPRQILVILTNDLVDVCKAGDDITISGRLIQRWMPLKEGARCGIELALLANNVSVRNDSSGIHNITDDLKDEFEQFWADARAARRCYTARNFILSCMCPQIYGASAR